NKCVHLCLAKSRGTYNKGGFPLNLSSFSSSLINMLAKTLISLLVASTLALQIVPLNDFMQHACESCEKEASTKKVEIGTGDHAHAAAVTSDDAKIPHVGSDDHDHIVHLVKPDSKVSTNATATATKTGSSATATASGAAGKSAVYGGVALAAALGAFVM
ncbi:hypothetical protein NEOLI_002752, partial [Neolecta irregularis DAH-3]